MICLNVLEHADLKYGGIATSVPALARAMAAEGRYRDCRATFCDASEHAGSGTVRLPAGRLGWFADRAARRTFDSLVSTADLIHIHGLWSQHALSAAGAAQRHFKPYVVSAHGMLEPWALHNKKWKKRVYGALVERRNLRRAACLRALTRQEALDYRRYGIETPTAVVPNGIDPPEAAASPEPFLAQYPHLRGRRLILFLGRVHYKKGLDILCRAWAATPRRADDHLVIGGPDFEGTRARLEALISELGVAAEVSFTGLLAGGIKWSALAAAHAFVLPSYSEGFSMAVLEALAAGVPVVVSQACHLPGVSHPRCGWIVQPETDSLAAALAECLEATPSDRARLGGNGRRLIRQRFTWPIVAGQMSSVYDWVLGGARPSNVEIFE